MLKAYYDRYKLEAGLDEAGRGCYAGPVYAAAVILPKKFRNPLLNDSKKLTQKEREELRPIIEREAIAFAVASVDNEEIDAINILQASYKAMHLAVEALHVQPECLLVDGNRFKPYRDLPYNCIIKGDGTYASIAAASVLAKTYRDDYMRQLHNEFQQYGWNTNKGYGTAFHRKMIEEAGICKYHRKTWHLMDVQLELF